MKKNERQGSQEETAREDEKKPRSILREILPYIIIFAVVILFRVFILINATIPSESMEDTIQTSSRAMGLKCAYWFSEPERGDIIVFYAPDTPDTLYVKRVIGVPGDTVEVVGGTVYLNGEALEELYLKEEMEDEDAGPYVVPEDSYFVMGDNRNNSLDARYWENTYVTSEMIVGKLYFSYWPSLDWIADSDGETFAGFAEP
ncbi:MAG: signal peptidase I [Lachnospiraceae bacterium]|nr:signal peptidase I [Lachnospiraceae bacterium]